MISRAYCFILALLVFAPLLAVAAAPADLRGIISTIVKLLDVVVPVIIGMALLSFFWGVIAYVLAGDDAERRGNARQFMIWGIVAIFVMVTFFGLARVVSDTFFGNDSYQDYRTFPKSTIREPVF